MKARWITRAKKQSRRWSVRHGVPLNIPNNYVERVRYAKLVERNYSALYDPPDNPNPEEILLEREMCEQIDAALLQLYPREERVLRLWYGLDGTPRTLEQVSDLMGVTRERIRQIAAKACRKLKHPSRRLLLLKDKYRYQYSSRYERQEQKRERAMQQRMDDYQIGTALPPPPKRTWSAPIMINLGSVPYRQLPQPHASLDDPMHVWTHEDVLRDMLAKALLARGLR